MAKYNIIKTPTFLTFSQEEKDIVEAGVDLYQHYLYVQKGDNRYAEKAQGKSYEEKEKLFNEGLVREAVKRSGLTFSDGYDIEAVVARHTAVRDQMFALISETLANIIPNTVLDEFGRFAEVRNAGWGDNFRFEIPNPNLFVVNTVADGIRRGVAQRLYNGEALLTPVNHEITIAEDLHRILAGKVNWGDWVTRISQSVQTKISTEVYEQLYNSYSSLNPNFQEAAYDPEQFVTLAERVEAANGGARVSVWGTRTALSKVVPDDEFAKFGYVGLGEEYNKIGYLGVYRGVNTFLISQRIKPNDPDYNFAIDDDAIYFVSMGADRPIKVGFEGSPLIFQSNSSGNADLTQSYTYQQKWDTKVITSSKYGIMKV